MSSLRQSLGRFVPSRSHARHNPDDSIRKMMGEKGFFGVQDWEKFYGVTFSEHQLEKVAAFPYEGILTKECPFSKGKAICETHFAYLEPRILSPSRDLLNLENWREIHHGGQPCFFDPAYADRYRTERFLSMPGNISLVWRLALREIVPDSTGLGIEEMRPLIPDGYLIPQPVSEAVKDMLVYQKSGEYPNKLFFAATSEVVFTDFRIVVGRCQDDGIRINDCQLPTGLVGLSVFRDVAA